MKRRTASIVFALALTAVALASIIFSLRHGTDEARCGDGFEAHGTRCCPAGNGAPPNRCIMHTCAAPLELVNGLGLVDGGNASSSQSVARGSCDAPKSRVHVPSVTVLVGPSDWEAEGRVAPRTVQAGPFEIDAFEVTNGALRCPGCMFPSPSFDPLDAARAASAVTRAEARVFCTHLGGRLPTEDEWFVAAAGASGKRYPWGDTGAVCRRAAFGLRDGPCARGADGPDTVGSHVLGDSALGIHDLAGNVAEWVEADKPIVRGGSFATSLATELRTWAREEVREDARDPRIGFRCVYDSRDAGGEH